MRPESVPKAGLSVPNRCNIIAFGRGVLSVKAHKGKALDGLTDGGFDGGSPSFDGGRRRIALVSTEGGQA